jgi:hypothetical protein
MQIFMTGGYLKNGSLKRGKAPAVLSLPKYFCLDSIWYPGRVDVLDQRATFSFEQYPLDDAPLSLKRWTKQASHTDTLSKTTFSHD